jgi:HEAT repeat protein
MTSPRVWVILLALLIPPGVARGQIGPPPIPAEFTEQVGRLDPKNDKAARLDALKWLNAHSRAKNAAGAIPALERCIRNDPDGEVRQKAVLGLALIAKAQDRPCPLAVVEALHDKVDNVRWQAGACTPLFKTFAPGSVEVLLRGAKSEKADLRSTSLLILARAAGKDRKALAVMEEAKRDKVFDVRHCAHMALFIARDRLEEHLPYLIRVREDPESLFTPGPEDPEVAKKERTQRNLILIGTAVQFIEWSDTRANDLADVLLKLLADKSPVMRRGAANLIGATAVKVELAKPREGDPFVFPETPKDGWSNSIVPLVDPEGGVTLKKDEKPPEPSKVALRLEKLKVEEKLTKLRDHDPDHSVREAADRALRRLASVSWKKP